MVREAMHSLGDVNYKITLVLFFLYQILAHMVFVYLLPEVRNHSYFFFKSKGTSNDTSFEPPRILYTTCFM
jgi:hypothetical protein